jgi:hypothetical protein
MSTDRFGNAYAPGLPYARGRILSSTEDDFCKLLGIITVHFVGLPPGTSALMFKFIAPEVLKRFGGAQAYAQAIDKSLNRLANMLTEPAQIHRLLQGDA